MKKKNKKKIDESAKIIIIFIQMKKKIQTKKKMPNRLYSACKRNDVKEVERIFQQGIYNNPDGLFASGLIPLHVAAEHGFFEVARLLVRAFANVNLRNSSGFTALSLAAEKGHWNVVSLLITPTLKFKLFTEFKI